MVQNYYYLLKKVREMRSQYMSLDLEQKLFLLNLQLKIEAKYIKPNECHTKAEKKAKKIKSAIIRKHNEKKGKK